MTATPRSPLWMDDDRQNLGNSPGDDGRGRLHVKVVGGALEGIDWDYFKETYPDAVTEIFTFKKGGSSGTTLAVVTIKYLASDKAQIDDVTVVRS